jgi:peptide/nickel transport system permease protein
VISRLLHAARFTLLVTVAATALSLLLGAALGFIAGWYGGWVGHVVEALISLFWTVPLAIFAILVLVIVGARAETLILVIAGVNWVSSARVFRAAMVRLRYSTFIRSARALGFSTPSIIVSQVLPNLRGLVVVLVGFGAAETLALESGLAYLGLSLPPPSPTWGGMMADGIAYLTSGWWVSLLPAGVVTLTIASFRALTSASSSPFQ